MDPSEENSAISPSSIFGWALFSVGLGLVAWAFTIDPSVSVREAARLMELPSEGLPIADARVNNVGLLVRQVLLCIVGAAFIVSGSVFACRR